MSKKRESFCIECRKYCEYEFKQVERKYVIKDKEYNMDVTVAFCKSCGSEIDVPGIMDYRAKEIDRQYREKEEIVSIDEIRKLMEIYNMGKAPLSLALGFGEITITRYLQGQVPSKEYSAIMKHALESPSYMVELLNNHRDKIGDVAFNKAIKATDELVFFMKSSDNLISTISYVFEKSKEITPLALQKILYYAQGIYMAIYKEPLYREDCVAWAHGPVYDSVYDIFKTFKYNPIDDDRYMIFKNKYKRLGEKEREIIDLVLDTFGMYSGKMLECITHKETPWIQARDGYYPSERSNVVIEKDSIKKYFEKLEESYDIRTAEGISVYIREKI